MDDEDERGTDLVLGVGGKGDSASLPELDPASSNPNFIPRKPTQEACVVVERERESEPDVANSPQLGVRPHTARH